MTGFGGHDIVRALVVAGIVGTILTMVNLGPAAYASLFRGQGEPWKVALNYAVPFVVSTVTSLLIHRAQGAKA